MIISIAASSRRVLTACCLLAAISGCGKSKQIIKDRANVSGTVTFDGKPLPAGVIGFQSTELKINTSAMIFDGSYFSDRAPLGKVSVTVDTSQIQFGNPGKYVPIPAKYNDSSTSGFTAEIKQGDNENLNFDLKK